MENKKGQIARSVLLTILVLSSLLLSSCAMIDDVNSVKEMAENMDKPKQKTVTEVKTETNINNDTILFASWNIQTYGVKKTEKSVYKYIPEGHCLPRSSFPFQVK